MSSEWKNVKVSDICMFLYGKNLPSEKRSTSGVIPVYGSSGITGYHNEAYVNEPGIIIGRKGTVGAINYSTKPFWPIDTTFYIPSSSVENIKYLYYLFKTIDFKNLGSDSAVPGLNRNAASSLKIKIPPISEQKNIAEVLSSLDDKIELNRQMCKTLEDIASTLFKTWFIYCDPVKAKVAGQEPEGLSPEIAKLFPDSFNSSSDALPKGWQFSAAYDLAEYINGAAYKDSHFTDEIGSLPIIKIVELKGEISSGTKFTKTNLGDKYKINTGDILFSWSGSPETSIDTFLWANGPAWLNQHIFKVNPKEIGTRAFIYFLLKHLKLTFINIAKNKQTTGLGHITVKDLKEIKVIKPDIEIMKAFENIANPIIQKIQITMEQSINLCKIRDSILPKLVSGILQVKDLNI